MIDTKRKVNAIKSDVIKTAYKAKEGHIPSAISIVDILYVLYSKVLRISLSKIDDPERDIFILSKGHASLGIYATLKHFKFIGENALSQFATFNSILGGHPDKNKIPGIEASTGSLGHGLPIAVGHAYSAKLSNSDKKIFVLIGDGEANEGAVWEAVLFAATHKLSNLTCIIDHNHSGDRAIDIGDVKEKFSAFDWEVNEVDGHCHNELIRALSQTSYEKPLMILANTIKGKGVVEMENNHAWHHKIPSENELKSFLEQLK